MRLISLGVVLACFTVWPSAAAAQLIAPTEAAVIQLGPVSFYPSARLTDAGQDSNVFNDVSDPKEDYTFTFVSNVLAVARLGQNELMMQSGGDYVWFKQYASQRYTSNRHAVRFNLAASRFKPFVGAVYDRTHARRGLEIDARAGRVERSALAGFAFELTERTSLTGSLRIDDTTYEAGEQFRGVDLATALNRKGRSFSGGMRYALTPFTTLLVLGDYAEDVFPLTHVRDSRSYSFAPALEFSPDAAIRGRIMAGFQVFEPLDSTLPQYTGSVLAADVSWSVYGRTSLDVQATRNVNYSYQDTQPYYLLTGVRAGINQPVFGPLDFHVGADWEDLSYLWRLGETTGAAPRQVDTTTAIFGGFRINIGRGYSAGITAERTARRSTYDPRQRFNRTRLLTSITIGS